MQVVAETLKVLLVAVTAALQYGGSSDGGDGGAAALMRVLLPLLVQVGVLGLVGPPRTCILQIVQPGTLYACHALCSD